MNQINIKEYFKTEKEKLRLAVIEPPSLTIVDLVICATGQPQSIHREQCESAKVL